MWKVTIINISLSGWEQATNRNCVTCSWINSLQINSNKTHRHHYTSSKRLIGETALIPLQHTNTWTCSLQPPGRTQSTPHISPLYDHLLCYTPLCSRVSQSSRTRMWWKGGKSRRCPRRCGSWCPSLAPGGPRTSHRYLLYWSDTCWQLLTVTLTSTVNTRGVKIRQSEQQQ